MAIRHLCSLKNLPFFFLFFLISYNLQTQPQQKEENEDIRTVGEGF